MQLKTEVKRLAVIHGTETHKGGSNDLGESEGARAGCESKDEWANQNSRDEEKPLRHVRCASLRRYLMHLDILV